MWLHCWIWDHRGLLRISTDWKWTLTWLQSGDRDKLPVYSDVLSWTVFLLCFLPNLVLWCVRSQVLFIRSSYISILKKKNPTHVLLFLQCLNTYNWIVHIITISPTFFVEFLDDMNWINDCFLTSLGFFFNNVSLNSLLMLMF